MHPRTLLLVLATACTLVTTYANTEMTARQTYIENNKDLAIQQMHQTMIPASIILAQAIYESGNGEGELATNANNHFGIKCKSYWMGDTYYLKDDDHDENGNLEESCFRKYKSIEESFRNHGHFLTTTPRYAKLFTYGNDYKKWAYGLKETGYASNPEYAEKLISIIEKHELYLLDGEPAKPLLEQLPSINQLQKEAEKAPEVRKPVIKFECKPPFRKAKKDEFEVVLERHLTKTHDLIQPVTRASVEAANPKITALTSFKNLPQQPIYRRFRMK